MALPHQIGMIATLYMGGLIAASHSFLRLGTEDADGLDGVAGAEGSLDAAGVDSFMVGQRQYGFGQGLLINISGNHRQKECR